jgi:Fe-S-cluster containining protein
MKNSQFYASGLKFSCKRCSSCCRYDPGFVYLSEKDLEKLTAELKLDRNSFLDKYCRWIKGLEGKKFLSLKEKSNKDCILWDSGCIVYTARPLQCRAFPFWDNILYSAQSWKMTASACPGMNKGELHTEKAIQEYIKLRETEPIINRAEVDK